MACVLARAPQYTGLCLCSIYHMYTIINHAYFLFCININMRIFHCILQSTVSIKRIFYCICILFVCCTLHCTYLYALVLTINNTLFFCFTAHPVTGDNKRQGNILKETRFITNRFIKNIASFPSFFFGRPSMEVQRVRKNHLFGESKKSNSNYRRRKEKGFSFGFFNEITDTSFTRDILFEIPPVLASSGVSPSKSRCS